MLKTMCIRSLAIFCFTALLNSCASMSATELDAAEPGPHENPAALLGFDFPVVEPEENQDQNQDETPEENPGENKNLSLTEQPDEQSAKGGAKSPTESPVEIPVEGSIESSVESSVASLQQELMSLSTDLLILEEDLLYPASSRVAVYLSMDLGELFRLDALTLKLNGKDVAHHLYTSRQVSALYRGGVQKLYVGNARQGANTLTAVFTGQGPHDRDYKRATTVEFEQSFEPVFVELGITDSTEIQQPRFSARVY